MSKYVQEQIPQTIAYSASAAATPLLIAAKPYWITSLLFGLELAKAGAATTATQDYPWRTFTGMTIRGGGRPYVNLGAPDGRPLYWATRLRTRGSYKTPDMQSGTQTIYCLLPLIFGVFPIKPNDDMNWFDATAGLQPDMDLTLGLTWAANTVIASATNTVANGTVVRVTLGGIVLEPGDSPIKYYPTWFSQQFSPAAASAGLSYEMKLTTGYWYRRTTVMVVNGTGTADTRNNGYGGTTAVSEFAVETKDGRRPINQKTWDLAHGRQRNFHVADDNSDVAGATLVGGASSTAAFYNAGVFDIDYAAIANTADPTKADPQYGVNLIGKSDGTLKLKATVDVATNTTINLLNEAMLAY
jgi:hypothetical protein